MTRPGGKIDHLVISLHFGASPARTRSESKFTDQKAPDVASAHRMSVISIQSQVAYGHVGNSAAVFPMQVHGIDVIAVPTTLLSNRPGYPTIRGRVLEAELVADLLLGVEERGALETCEAILSGYLGSAEIGAVVADFIQRAKARNPALSYACDPVLGDRDGGLFVRADIPPLMRDRLCPLADIITPNHFEFEWLCGAKAGTIDDVIAQAQALMARGPSTIVITSAELADTPDGAIETIAVERSQARYQGWRVATPKLPISPSGTGDLFASLLVSARVRGSNTPDALSHAASAIFAVLERTAARGTEEMRIVGSAALLVHPTRRFVAVAVGH
jgi:pyridoxine kinase